MLMPVMTSLRPATATLLLLTSLAACGGSSPTAQPTNPAATSSATPTSSLLTMTGLTTGDAPKIAWSRGTLLNGHPDKDVLPGRLDQFVESKQLLVVRDIDGNVYAYSPDGPTGGTPIGKASGSLAVNRERNLVAWIATDGSPTVLQEGEAKPAVLERQEGVTTGDAVAIRGHDCFSGPETVEGAGCSVYFRATGADEPQSFVASNHGFVESLRAEPGPYSLRDADDNGEVGWNKLNDDELTTCSRYTPYGAGEEAVEGWDTCHHLPLDFSPDGKHVLAVGPVGFEGAGAGEVTILDRSNGKQVSSVQNSATSQVFVTDLAWEDDDHVLANVNDGKTAAIIRIGIDGAMELAVKPTPMDETAVNPLPFRLGIQP